MLDRSRSHTPAHSTCPPAARGSRRRSRSVLSRLGIVGWDQIEPVIIAAVAAEFPLLLVGPHGSAKTMLLKRLAECLGLEHRQYNASLLNFDDLVGFPVPEDGKIVYLQTPATIWEAESVFFDEISRCRPDLQNKLFPIVHDRVVQGVPLGRLRHRWAAMNPPPNMDDKSGSPDYVGAEPLDVALADRFAFIATVPSFGELEQGRPAASVAARRSAGRGRRGLRSQKHRGGARVDGAGRREPGEGRPPSTCKWLPRSSRSRVIRFPRAERCS